ncbi:MAG: CaiB/BaiF CoA transferase family protein [Acidimicrobiales bacterium]
MTAPLLEGLRVLDLGIWRPVPYATQLLVEMGADVVKIEPPGGDPMRVFPELFAVLNAGKRSMVADLKTDAGRDRVLALAAGADVFMEGFRPGVADRLGVGYETVRTANSRIVYCSVSGYGETGPLASVPGHDINYQAYAGVLTARRGRPVAVSLPVGDLGAGMAAAMTTLAACLRARTTGEGERIDIAIADVLATWTGAVARLTPAWSPRTMDGLPAYGIYRTSDDQFVTIGVLAEEHFWSRFCKALGLTELEDIAVIDRVVMKEQLDEQVTTAVARLSLAEIQQVLEKNDVPVAPVLSREEMLEHDHFRDRGTVLTDVRPGREGLASMGHLARYSFHPPMELEPFPELDVDAERSWLDR